MKTQQNIIVLISFFILSINQSFAQKQACGTEATPQNIEHWEHLKPGFQSFLNDFENQFSLQNRNGGNAIDFIPIQPHILRRSNGSGGLTLIQFQEALDSVNHFFLNANMQFFVCGSVNFIDNDIYYDFTTPFEGILAANFDVQNVINIYFFNSIIDAGGNGLCGYSRFPPSPDRVMMANSCALDGSTLTHELGHYFALYHTHGKSNCGLMTDELADGSNCADKGDDVCDTPAEPNLRNISCTNYLVDNACNYIGSLVDSSGMPFSPYTTNIMSYSRANCKNQLSIGQYARMAYTYKNLRNYLECPTFHPNFSADKTQKCTAPLTVNFTDQSIGGLTYRWDFGDGSPISSAQNPSHTYTQDGDYDVCLSISDGNITISKTVENYINVGGPLSLPHFEDFENFTVTNNATGFQNDWQTNPKESTILFRWNPDNGGTPTNSTGPLVDHTTGNSSGKYIYTEATSSAQNPGDVAELFTPCFDLRGLTGLAIVKFYYHMFDGNSGHMGNLHFDIKINNTWINDITPAINGQHQTAQTDAFLERIIDVSAYIGQVVQFRFRAIRGPNFRSDIAIDDFEIFEDSSTPLPVELAYFTGEKISLKQNLLEWETNSEINFNYFEIQKASNNRDFKTIGTIIQLAGKKYSFVDEQILEQNNFYRLKMVDLNGEFSYSNIVYIHNKIQHLKIENVFPNPSNQDFNIELKDALNGLNISVFNQLGQIVERKKLEGQQQNFNLNLVNQANGIYHLKIQYGNQVAFYKLIKN